MVGIVLGVTSNGSMLSSQVAEDRGGLDEPRNYNTDLPINVIPWHVTELRHPSPQKVHNIFSVHDSCNSRRTISVVVKVVATECTDSANSFIMKINSVFHGWGDLDCHSIHSSQMHSKLSRDLCITFITLDMKLQLFIQIGRQSYTMEDGIYNLGSSKFKCQPIDTNICIKVLKSV